MCYYSSLKDTGGKCRVCLVKVAQSSEANPRPMPKLVASCLTRVEHGMVVENESSPEVLEARNGVVEFLLINHPWIVLFAIRQENAICKIFPTNMVLRNPL